MTVSEVDPVMDGVARADGNLNPSSNRIVLEIIGKALGSRPEAREMVEQAFPGFCGQGAQCGHDFQIDEEAIRHGRDYSGSRVFKSSSSTQFSGFWSSILLASLLLKA